MISGYVFTKGPLAPLPGSPCPSLGLCWAEGYTWMTVAYMILPGEVLVAVVEVP